MPKKPFTRSQKKLMAIKKNKRRALKKMAPKGLTIPQWEEQARRALEERAKGLR